MATYTEKNDLWHTGVPRNLRDDTNVKECQPWEHVERVATSRSVGEGCAQPEWYQKAVYKIVENMFCM